MTPLEFILKWRRSRGQEAAGAQEWFIDLCRVVGHGTPNELDPMQSWFTFERSLREASGRQGRADVYKQGYFAWEFKGLHRDLNDAYAQLQRYREALNNPPILVVSDFRTIEVHTNFTNKVSIVHTIPLSELDEPDNIELLRNVFNEPLKLEPRITPDDVTRETTDIFAEIAISMRVRGIDSLEVARFLNRLVFCFFAQDVRLLPDRVLSDLCENYNANPPEFDAALSELFHSMNEGKRFGFTPIPHFNGDLFKDPDTVLMTDVELEKLVEATQPNWAHIDPSIFGTLFERVIDPEKQGLIGAEYTTEDDILAVINPVIMDPLRVEWSHLQAQVGALLLFENRRDEKQATELLQVFQSRIASITVLDPACGSGNFLYVALRQLRDLEKDILRVAAEHDLHGFAPQVSPEQFLGIERDEYASELARTSLWIGYLQWSIENGYPFERDPVLSALNTIERRDAILTQDEGGNPTEPEWPPADYIVGNPPFLGHVPFREQLGDEYVEAVYALYGERIPNSSDLCCYWFEKARAEIEAGRCKRAGLLATQAIRFQSNRPVLERIKQSGDIFHVVSDREWRSNDPDTASVHISIICFDDGIEQVRVLDDIRTSNINADLTRGPDLTQAMRLTENRNQSFQGISPVGDFEITEEVALDMMEMPNPHGKPNSDVIKRWINGTDITNRPRNMWIIDFGTDISEEDAALYEAPFERIKERVRPTRLKNEATWLPANWWFHGHLRISMRRALTGLGKYIATSLTAKHRFFIQMEGDILPSSSVVVFARDDDYFFGILQSHIHTLWAEGAGSQLREAESGLRYTPTTCFETFPFPRPDEQREAVATAANELNMLRENWLNPTDMLGQPALSESQLRRRTLTNLYNDNPTWPQNAHAKLDAAVADAYGWPHDLTDEQVLDRLLALNLERAAAEEAATE
ncbi:MAG: class I SAM-dependent DNA methyltransferase [Chloroflexi bacterium]|nr:class I SAM-dependent DNA methyltransferase [Chloroflexota bacterium]